MDKESKWRHDPQLASTTHEEGKGGSRAADATGQTNCLRANAPAVAFLRLGLTESARNANWLPREDVALCLAWVSIAENGFVGCFQTIDTMWGRIYKKFLANNPGTKGENLEYKDDVNLASKLSTNNVTLWSSPLSVVHRNPASGSNVEYTVNSHI
ncbi:unnamed protein product [Malus baccata var. baccata]